MVGNALEKYSGLSYYRDFEEAIGLDGLEAAIIATPSQLHEQMIRSALDRNLHIFCEKPLTLSGSTSRELAGLAAERALVTQVGYHNRFIATFGEVQRLLDAGAIGTVSHALAEAYGPVVLRPSRSTWRTTSSAGGGCLYDYAAHPLNLLNWYFGDPIGCSGAVLKSMYSAETEDEVYATLQFADGVTAQLSVNWSDESVRKMSTKVAVWGAGGKIFADRQEIQVYIRSPDTAPEGYRQGWNVKYTTDLTPPVSFYLRGEEYSAQLENFAAACAERRIPNANDFASAAVTDVSLDLIRAASAGAGGLVSQAPARPRERVLARLFGTR
jgi:predicted dehydrogenase